MKPLDLTQFEGHDGPCACEPPPSVSHCERCMRHLALRNAAPELLAEVKRYRAALEEARKLGTHRVQAGDDYASDVADIVDEALEGK